MIISTSRYSNPALATTDLVPIGITRFGPRFRLRYELRANLFDLAPTERMLALSKEAGHQAFRDAYTERLEALGLATMIGQIAAIVGSAPGAVLLCFEDVRGGFRFCHRRILAEWNREKSGVDWSELADPIGSADRSAIIARCRSNQPEAAGCTEGDVMAARTPTEPVACPTCRQPCTRATLGRHLVEAHGLPWEDAQFVARNLAAMVELAS